ncbi:MAG: tRNA lysidine(34) synthetase TilS [Alphaproteobacteria bacterium]|nr:tRNA lysidine(34) synthetase TilS [Alphaproteobacteria bacterium]
MFKDFLTRHDLAQETIAVGVSGGADSLALALMLCDELKAQKNRIIALTVDHGLRPSSKKEAQYVADIMKKNGIEHHILIWKGQKPKTGIEEAARQARYRLIKNWCVEHNVRFLMTAHHLLDQAETFFMRLERGSGLSGLCGMNEATHHHGITVLRPLLSTHPDVLKDYLKKRSIAWVEDESNNDSSLLRVKIRKFLPVFEKQTGITPSKIAQTMLRLQGSRNYFDRLISKLFKNNFKSYKNKAFRCSKVFFQALDDEIAYRLLCFIIQTTAQTDYAPEAQKIFKLLKKLGKPNFKAATLGHCQMICMNGFLWFVPEHIQNMTYSRQKWNDFIKENPQYKAQKIPLPVKKILTGGECSI